MTDNEIVKALKECFVNRNGAFCDICPYNNGMCNEEQLAKDALDLINRLQADKEYYKKNRDKYQNDVMFLSKQCDELQAENESWQAAYMTEKQEIANLEIELKAMRGAANSYKAEVKRLENLSDCYYTSCQQLAQSNHEIKAEAYKECIEKVKAKSTDIGVCDAQGNNYGGATVVFVNELDNLLKEMEGGASEVED